MSTALLRPRPLPLERARPGVLLLVLALHLGLLWVANQYWPLQSLVQSALQSTSTSFAIQILQGSADRVAAAVGADGAPTGNSQAISNPRRQRFGRAAQMLDLPAPQTQTSTPLTGMPQTTQTSQISPAKLPKPEPVEVAPQPAAAKSASLPERAVRSLPPEPALPSLPEKVPEPSPPNLVSAPALAPTQAPNPALAPAPAPAPAFMPSPSLALRPAASAETPTLVAGEPQTSRPASATATQTVVLPSLAPAATGSATSPLGSATTAAQGAAAAGPPASRAGDVAPAQGQTGINAPLNLNTPPRYIYRPPVALPRRSLSEMANEQLRRKPRDPFADGIGAAGNIDCLKETPDGPAQGLLAIGPLLKRAMEEKCRK